MKENGTLETLNGAYIQPRIDAQNEVIDNFKTQTSNSIAKLINYKFTKFNN